MKNRIRQASAGADPLLSIPRAAALMGVGKTKVRELVDRGLLRGLFVDPNGSCYRIRRSELERYLAEREAATAAELELPTVGPRPVSSHPSTLNARRTSPARSSTISELEASKDGEGAGR